MIEICQKKISRVTVQATSQGKGTNALCHFLLWQDAHATMHQIFHLQSHQLRCLSSYSRYFQGTPLLHGSIHQGSFFVPPFYNYKITHLNILFSDAVMCNAFKPFGNSIYKGRKFTRGFFHFQSEGLKDNHDFAWKFRFGH